MNHSAQVLLVTGGGRGIGAATAVLAAERGYSVCVNYREDAGSAGSVVNWIRQRGGNALAVQADVGNETDVGRLFETVDHELGCLTALVNNAGTLERQATLEEMDASRIHRVFATNAIGAMLCAKEAVRRMSTRHGGTGGGIVNVSSLASRFGSPNEYVDYAASKGAVDTFTVGLAKEVASVGIRVNCVRPGFIHTELHTLSGEPDRVERVQSRTAMNRGGQPEEVARAILWLLSDEASYVTGVFLDVAGGL